MIVPRVEVKGQVLEADNATPHSGATVYFGHYGDGGAFGNVVAVATTSQDGSFLAQNVPADQYDIVAVSLDGKRKGERGKTPVTGTGDNYVSIALQNRARVIGRVETSTGVPVTNAIVAGGEALVRTDASGGFTLTGVPTGQRTISVGVEPNPDAGFDFPRLGSAGVSVISGMDNFVVVRLNAMGRIVGRVLDADGKPVGGIRVALPEADGFQWVNADGDGYYKFDNLGLGQSTVSAPSGPAVNNDTSKLVETIRTSGSEDEIMAAIGEAFSIFTGAADPYLNGEGSNFNPGAWGFSNVNLNFDGQTAVADIRYLRTGTISGVVVNGQGVPIGARVRLTGLGPLPSGMPGTVLRGEQDSDPALGTFEFANQAFAGPWGLQAATPFYPLVITLSGQTYSTSTDVTNIVLAFPAVADLNGRLVGFVHNPDGSRVGAEVNVRISFANDYVIRTDTNGFFDTQIALPAFETARDNKLGGPRTYHVEAEDPSTGLRGTAFISLQPGITNAVHVTLLSRGSMDILVRQASGTPAIEAALEIRQGSYPFDNYQATTDANGLARVENIFEGMYAVGATAVSGATTIYGRAGIKVLAGQTNTVTIDLTPTGNIRGNYVMLDGVTPVTFAQIALSNLGFMTSDTNGLFQLDGVPLGTYRLTSQDPVSGIGASAWITLTFPSETAEVALTEEARGEITGTVINGYGTGVVPGAQVTLTFDDGITGARTVSTGPDGVFSFPGSPAGGFQITAIDPVGGLKARDRVCCLKARTPSK